MQELLQLINRDIRQEFNNPALSEFNFVFEAQEDDLEEGVEVENWFTDRQNGIQIQCDGLFLIKVIFLYSGRKEEKFLPYRGQIIGNLSFEDSKSGVVNALGEPSISRDPFDSKFFGSQGGYDRYDLPEWSIHFQYSSAEQQIELITIMSPDVLPSPPF